MLSQYGSSLVALQSLILVLPFPLRIEPRLSVFHTTCDTVASAEAFRDFHSLSTQPLLLAISGPWGRSTAFAVRADLLQNQHLLVTNHSRIHRPFAPAPFLARLIAGNGSLPQGDWAFNHPDVSRSSRGSKRIDRGRWPNMPLQPTVTRPPNARVRAAGSRQRLNAGR